MSSELGDNRTTLPDVPPDAAESHDAAVIRALAELQSDLAGLFRIGRELCSRPDEPGLGYLIAHVGRELSRGVIRALELPFDEEGTSGEESDDETQQLNETIAKVLGLASDDAEVPRTIAALSSVPELKNAFDELTGVGHRKQIARGLGLPETDPSVTRWRQVHQRFVRDAHWRTPEPEAAPLRAAFQDLASLLYGRVGPIFDTEARLDVLAEIEQPTPHDLETLRPFLLRPIQRRRFFQRLHGAGWLGLLTAAGYFNHAPERQVYADGSWRPRQWPEGEYLLRIARDDPDRVAKLLHAIPEANSNPLVWGVVADAIPLLPANLASETSGRLARGLRNTPRVLLPHHVLKTIQALVAAKNRSAFGLSEALLWPITRVVPERKPAESDESYSERLEDIQGAVLTSDSWVFARMDEHDFDRFIRDVLPALEAFDARETLKLLSDTLQRIDRQVARARSELRNAVRPSTEPTSEPGSEDETILDSLERLLDPLSEEADDATSSADWCSDLRGGGYRRGIRNELAVATFEVASRLGTDEQALGSVIKLLGKHRGEIFHRMELLLMADAQTVPSDYQPRISRIVGSDEALRPPFRAREMAPFLRARFGDASPDAKREFVERLEHGPSEEGIVNLLAWREAEDTPETRAEVIADWQRSYLRWFHDRIPAELHSLAERLGAKAEVPSAMQQSLDEVGSYSHGGGSVAHKSPISEVSLRSMDAPALVDYLVSFQQPQASGDPFESPSVEGLQNVLARVFSEEPRRIGDFIAALADRSVPLGYLTAVSFGLRDAARQKRRGDVRNAIAFAHIVFERSTSVSQDDTIDHRHAAAVSVCELVSELIDADEIDASNRDVAWEFAKRIIQDPFVWSKPVAEPASTFDQARQRSWNDLPGQAVEMLVKVAWTEFYENHENAKWPPPESSETSDRLVPLLDQIWKQSGPSAVSAMVILGQSVDKLYWMAPGWMDSHIAGLFDGGATRPAEKPAWGAWNLRNSISKAIFEKLASWYELYAQALRDGNTAAQDPEGTIRKEFSENVTIAAFLGLIHPGDDRRILENTFASLPVDERSHAYWLIFRSWSDSTRADVEPLNNNVLAFWDWRLRELEAAPPSPEREEEADGLLTLLATPHLPAESAIAFGRRTAALVSPKRHSNSLMWQRVGDVAASNPSDVLDIVEYLVNATLKAEYSYLSFDDVAPPLRAAIKAGGEVRQRALNLINRIGEAGFEDFEQLWKEGKASGGEQSGRASS